MENAQRQAEREAIEQQVKEAGSAAEKRKKKLELSIKLSEERKANKNSKEVSEKSLTGKTAFSSMFDALNDVSVAPRAQPADPLALPAAPKRPVSNKAKLDKTAIAHFSSVVSAPAFKSNPLEALRKHLTKTTGEGQSSAAAGSKKK